MPRLCKPHRQAGRQARLAHAALAGHHDVLAVRASAQLLKGRLPSHHLSRSGCDGRCQPAAGRSGGGRRRRYHCRAPAGLQAAAIVMEVECERCEAPVRGCCWLGKRGQARAPRRGGASALPGPLAAATAWRIVPSTVAACGRPSPRLLRRGSRRLCVQRPCCTDQVYLRDDRKSIVLSQRGIEACGACGSSCGVAAAARQAADAAPGLAALWQRGSETPALYIQPLPQQ